MYHLDRNKFHEIEHTADTGMQVTGLTVEELFANAAFSMLSVIYTRLPEQAQMEKSFELDDSDLSDLLVRWLSEINYLLTVHHFLPSIIPDLNIHQGKNGYILKATLNGMNSKKYEEYFRTEVKAVTYHQLALSQNEYGYHCRIIFDI